jgi:hypothetical protein
MNFDIVEYCWEHKIIVLCLPSHATHLLQPLEVGVFRHYQHWYGMEVAANSWHGKTGIGKHNFMEFLEPARQKTFQNGTICSRAFKSAEAWPFNPDAAKRRIPEPCPPSWTPPAWVMPLEDSYREALSHLESYEREQSRHSDVPVPEWARLNSAMLRESLNQLHHEVERQRAEISFLTYEKDKTQRGTQSLSHYLLNDIY